MIAASETRTKIRSEEELQSLPGDGFIHDTVDGESLLLRFPDIIASLLKAWE